jgi:hypothetical protein
MESSSIIERIVTDFLENNLDILCLDKQLKQFTINIAEKHGKYFLFDERYSIEIIFPKQNLNEILILKDDHHDRNTCSNIKINKFTLKISTNNINECELFYHIYLLPEEFELLNIPLKNDNLPKNIDKEYRVYMKIHEYKHKELQVSFHLIRVKFS